MNPTIILPKGRSKEKYWWQLDEKDTLMTKECRITDRLLIRNIARRWWTNIFKGLKNTYIQITCMPTYINITFSPEIYTQKNFSQK